MKKKKLLSIGALALIITTCTSVNASAATSAKRSAFQSVVTNGLNGKEVFSDIEITAKTPIKNYLTDKFIEEINSELEGNDLLKQYEIKISRDNNLYDIQSSLVEKLHKLDYETKNEILEEIKEVLKSKLGNFKNCTDSQLEDKIKYYFKTSDYGKLIIGRNSNNKKTVSLVDAEGNILVQVNSSNIHKAKEKLNAVSTYEDLKDLILEYYPSAEDYLK